MTKFVTPLLIPPVMPRAGSIRRQAERHGRLLRDLGAAVRAADPAQGPAPDDRLGLRRGGFGQQARSADPQRALVDHRSAGGSAGKGQVDQRARWTPAGNYLPHLLPVDQTLHWANPPGGYGGARHAARFHRAGHPGPYTGPVPMVSHVHGAVGVGDDSDGYAEAWYLPNAARRPGRLRRQRAPGTTSSPARRSPRTASTGDPAMRPSSTRTTTAPRRSGTTTTPSA